MAEHAKAKAHAPAEPAAPAVLAVDVGGSHVKMLLNGARERRRFASNRKLTPADMVSGVVERTADWRYEVVSVGVPAPVQSGRVVHDPVNLGKGWVGFDFEAAFGKPTKMINDAAMQALGSYEGGRMLFLGLGTGLGSAMVVDGILEPMELAHLPFRSGTFEDYVGSRGMKKLGLKRWRKAVRETIGLLAAALEPEYVVLGGGNADQLDELPPNVRLGNNEDAFLGGFRLWIDERGWSHSRANAGTVTRLSSPPMDDLGAPSSYLALEPGVYVFSRDGDKLGEVQYVLADPEADLFDGIVVDTSGLPGGMRFADALQVAEIYERGVILALSSADAKQLPEPTENPGVIEVTGVEDVDRTELREKLRRAWETITGEGLDKR